MEGEEHLKTTGSMEAGDAAAAAVQKTSNRVTLDYLNSLVVREEYTNPMSVPQLTICTLLVANGFALVGKSAPADPENFDLALGRKFAREDALKQLWPLEGYLLRQKLHEGSLQVAADPPADPPSDLPGPSVTDAPAPAPVPAPGGLRPLPGSTEVAPVPEPVDQVGQVLEDAPKAAAPPAPSVGRVVHFRSNFKDDIGSTFVDVVPAIITAVHSAGCVNLTVFRDGMEPKPVSSVEYAEDLQASGRVHCWSWPPRV